MQKLANLPVLIGAAFLPGPASRAPLFRVLVSPVLSPPVRAPLALVAPVLDRASMPKALALEEDLQYQQIYEIFLFYLTLDFKRFLFFANLMKKHT